MSRAVLAVSVFLVACAHDPRGPEPAPIAVMLPTSTRGPLDPPGGWELPGAANPSERDRCVHGALAARGLDAAGNPSSTSSSGNALGLSKSMAGNGEVLRERPDIATECTRAPGERGW